MERRLLVGLEAAVQKSGGATASSKVHPAAVQIPLADLHIGPTARSGVSQARVAALAEAPGSWSPLLVQRETLAILDGVHRYHAALELGVSMLQCEIFDGDEHEAFVEAVRRNVSQGLPLRLPERQRAARRLLSIRGEWSDRMIASICGLSPATVRELRRCSTARNGQLNRRLGADGRLRPIDREDLHRRTEIAVRANPSASLREIAREVHASPTTVAKIRALVHASNPPAAPSVSTIYRHGHTESTANVGVDDRSHVSWEEDTALQARASSSDLLEWFCRTNISEEWRDQAYAVPLSRVYEIADEARRRASCWARFAEVVEARAKPNSSPRASDHDQTNLTFASGNAQLLRAKRGPQLGPDRLPA
jgi:hypothetical protein